MHNEPRHPWRYVLVTAAASMALFAVLHAAVIEPKNGDDTRPGREWAAQLAELPPAARADLLQARERVWRAWFAGDEAALLGVLPPETIALAAGADGWSDRAAIIRSSREFARAGGTLTGLEFPRTEIQVYGATAILYTSYAFETETAGKRGGERGKAVEIFVRRGNTWVNSGWQIMPDPAAAP